MPRCAQPASGHRYAWCRGSQISALRHWLQCNLQGELDELEREEFFRLKKVQKKKKKDEEARITAKVLTLDSIAPSVYIVVCACASLDLLSRQKLGVLSRCMSPWTDSELLCLRGKRVCRRRRCSRMEI